MRIKTIELPFITDRDGYYVADYAITVGELRKALKYFSADDDNTKIILTKEDNFGHNGVTFGAITDVSAFYDTESSYVEDDNLDDEYDDRGHIVHHYANAEDELEDDPFFYEKDARRRNARRIHEGRRIPRRAIKH